MSFVITTDTPITYPGPAHSHADLVVIGGGVIGVCTALYAARAGHRVVLLEKGRIAAEQSSRNWGWIRQQGRDPDELPIMIESIRLWQELAKQTNVDIGLRQTGTTYLAQTEAQLQGYADWMPIAKANDLDTKILSASDVARKFPSMNSKSIKGALVTATDLRAEPWVAVPALAAIAAREGVQIVENCAVRMLDISGGRVAGVTTETGHIAAPEVVLAGGAWSSLFLRNHGISIPQLSVRENVAATEPLPDIHAGAAATRKVAFRRRTDGGYTLAPPGAPELFIGPDAFRAFPKYLAQLRAEPFGQKLHPFAPKGFPDAWGTTRHWGSEDTTPFEKMRILDPSPNTSKIKKLLRDFEQMFPELPPVRLKKAWAGMIDTMPDIVPVVDRVAKIPGLTVGTGMSGHGFGIGPAMGRVLASLALGENVGYDLHRFRLSRFIDGSKMRPGPNV